MRGCLIPRAPVGAGDPAQGDRVPDRHPRHGGAGRVPDIPQPVLFRTLKPPAAPAPTARTR